MFGSVARITRSGSSPGMKAKSRRRISNPPPVGGVTPALIATVLPVSVVTVSPVRLARHSGSYRRRQPSIRRHRRACLDRQVIGPVIGERDRILHQVGITRAITHFDARTTTCAFKLVEGAFNSSASPGHTSAGKACSVSAVSSAPQRTHSRRGLLHHQRCIAAIRGTPRRRDWSLNQSMQQPLANPLAPAPAGWQCSRLCPPPCPRCGSSPQSARRQPAWNRYKTPASQCVQHGTRPPPPLSPRAAYTARHSAAYSPPSPTPGSLD